MVNECRSILKPEESAESDKQAKWKQNYSHFESLPEDVRRQKTLSLRNMIPHGDPTEN